jgi:predicted transcriptional regulator
MDWKQLITDLLATGMTQAEIARKIGVTQSAISHVLNQKGQKGFKFEPGQKLVNLHRRTMAKAKAESSAASDDAQPPTGGSSDKIREAQLSTH